MGAATYPDERVTQFLNSTTVPTKIEVTQAGEAGKRFAPVWTPTYVFIDPETGNACHRAVGYLTPTAFLTECHVGLGMVALAASRYAEAETWFRRAADIDPKSDEAAQAQYWLGVAQYRADGKPDRLLGTWKGLLAAKPESTWARRASFIPH